VHKFLLVNYKHVGFEVITTVVMKSTIYCDITACSPLRVNRCFGGTYLLHLKGRKKYGEQETNVKAGGKQKHSFFFPEDGGNVAPKRQILNGLHGVISQKMVLFNF
jgi:hypothetical protein